MTPEQTSRFITCVHEAGHGAAQLALIGAHGVLVVFPEGGGIAEYPEGVRYRDTAELPRVMISVAGNATKALGLVPSDPDAWTPPAPPPPVDPPPQRGGEYVAQARLQAERFSGHHG